MIKFSQAGSTNRKRTIRLFQVLAACSALTVFAAGCGMPGKSGQAVADIKLRGIKTEAVAKRKISSPIEQVADIAAGTTWDVVPKANGDVKEVLKKRGDYVEKGEVLFTLDSSDAESAKSKNELTLQGAQDSLKQAKLDRINNEKTYKDNVTKAETTLRTAQQDYNKMLNDYNSGLVTQHQVDQNKDTLDNAKMNLESARNSLDAFENNDTVASAERQVESSQLALDDSIRSLDNYSIKAPGSGILTDFTVVAGQNISSASGKVGQIQQIDPIKIKTELTETNDQLVKGKKELVYYDPDAPDKKGKAAVSYLAPIMSAANKTYTLELEIANADHQLQPGKRYMVQLTTDSEEQVVAVPVTSIVREESDTFVFVQQGDQYAKRKVKLGRINDEYQEVLDGVKEGEQLVIVGQNTLKDGQKVESPQPAQTQAQSAVKATTAK